jgi:L-arabinose isomerase
MIDFGMMEVGFATGSQHLYGDQTLKTVALHANEIAGELARSKAIPLSVVSKPVLTTPDAIRFRCERGSRHPGRVEIDDDRCAESV